MQRWKVFAESEGDMPNANCKHRLKITKPKTLSLTMLIVHIILKGYMLSFGRCPLELLLLVWVWWQIFKIISVLVMRRGQVPTSWNAWVGGEARFLKKTWWSYVYIYPIQYSTSSQIPTQHWFEPAIKGGVIMGWGACSCERKGIELLQTWSQNWPLIFLHANIHHNMCPIWCGVWFEHHTLGLWFWSAIKVICKVILSLIWGFSWTYQLLFDCSQKVSKIGYR